jgi:hypothetical protein
MLSGIIQLNGSNSQGPWQMEQPSCQTLPIDNKEKEYARGSHKQFTALAQKCHSLARAKHGHQKNAKKYKLNTCLMAKIHTK